MTKVYAIFCRYLSIEGKLLPSNRLKLEGIGDGIVIEVLLSEFCLPRPRETGQRESILVRLERPQEEDPHDPLSLLQKDVLQTQRDSIFWRSSFRTEGPRHSGACKGGLWRASDGTAVESEQRYSGSLHTIRRETRGEDAR